MTVSVTPRRQTVLSTTTKSKGKISPKCLIWSDVPVIDVFRGRVRQTIAPFVRGFVWDGLGLDIDIRGYLTV